MRLFPRAQVGPGPCPVCGAKHSACIGDSGVRQVRPEVIDQRFGAPWRFRSLRDVRRKLPGGRYELAWIKGMPIPPEEAVRQGVVIMAELTKGEHERVEAFLQKNKKGAGS